MNIKEINEEVFYSEEDILKLKNKDIEFLKIKAADNKRGRARLCTHASSESSLHEMLIVLNKKTYVRPHKHLGKSESFHIIEGNLKVVIFDEKGNVSEVINMGGYNSQDKFYYKLSETYFHTVIPLSDFVVFHETTNGPFKCEDTIFAEWAPLEEESEARKIYLNSLKAQLEVDKKI
ncbi:MAG: WbuC family cupin fold metalloprotein [Candidatus Omnitrophica bacterium]|nr:WbuC family cupin fold metalloprotein [Candidatus Omnitrophota bacterium]